ncbi:MAG: tetraacyldisaccharide 4'-kinase, partial [Tannerella sp.]|nr:tetraacyldisaccharide 4'-kinase [Tannerella sp.]
MYRKNKVFVRCLLMPFALIYGFVTGLRNMLFDIRVLPSVKFPIPVICVGNIAVGGTGKTPITEYLVALLQKQYRVATLSRGYKRQTHGFRMVTATSTAAEAGDEACQIKTKFPRVTVAVDANRRRGIRRLLALPTDERPEVILLDDAMQHRYVAPSLTIMLTEYDNMFYEDTLLPAGSLREYAHAVYRADIVIVTKCTGLIKPIDLR